MNEDNASEGIISRFSEHQFQTLRGHDTQSLMNKCRLNLEVFNVDFQVYNYQVMLLLLDTLLAETLSKLSPEEEKQIMTYQELLWKLLDKYPIHKQIRRTNKFVTSFNPRFLKIFRKGLFDYEILVRKYREQHGFSGPIKKKIKRVIS